MSWSIHVYNLIGPALFIHKRLACTMCLAKKKRPFLKFREIMDYLLIDKMYVLLKVLSLFLSQKKKKSDENSDKNIRSSLGNVSDMAEKKTQ